MIAKRFLRSAPGVCIIAITHDRLIRADFAPNGSELESLQSAPRAPGKSDAEAVKEAIGLGGRLRRKVWVLCESLWIQTVSLNRGQVNGLAPAQITRALTFEIEPFSGIPVSESVAGYREDRGDDRTAAFWIVQATREKRNAIQRAIVALGGQLAGICHPAGVPQSLSKATRGWARLEAWSGHTVSVTAAGGEIQTRVLTAAPTRSQLPSAGALEILQSRGGTVAMPGEMQAETFCIDEPQHLRAWICAWYDCLESDRQPVPMVAPAVPEPLVKRHVVAGIALEAALVLVFLVHGGCNAIQRRALAREQAEIAQTLQQFNAVTKQNSDLQRKLADLEKQEKQREQVAARRGALPELLRSLALTRPDDVVVRSIRAENLSSLVVSGISIEATAIDELSIVLNESLRPSGWSARPVDKTARRTLANGGPWEFSLNVSHNDSSSLPSAPRQANQPPD